MTCAAGTYGPLDTGGGPLDPVSGLRDWYQPEPDETPGTLPDAGKPIYWDDILVHWRELALDLHDRHIDVGSNILRERSWAWFSMHVTDIADTPNTRLNTALKGA